MANRLAENCIIGGILAGSLGLFCSGASIVEEQENLFLHPFDYRAVESGRKSTVDTYSRFNPVSELAGMILVSIGVAGLISGAALWSDRLDFQEYRRY